MVVEYGPDPKHWNSLFGYQVTTSGDWNPFSMAFTSKKEQDDFEAEVGKALAAHNYPQDEDHEDPLLICALLAVFQWGEETDGGGAYESIAKRLEPNEDLIDALAQVAQDFKSNRPDEG
jgi:hypothetical protein